MEIEILGTRGEIKTSKPYHSRHSGVLIDQKILLDLGEKEYLKYQPEYIFITHLHPDHAFFVRKNKEIKAKINSPENFKDSKKFSAYQITAIPTHHSKKVNSQAYLIQKNKKKILYTGDLIGINKQYHDKLKNLDLVITEGSFLRKGGLVRRDKKTGEIYGHNGIPNLINLFKKFTNNIIFMHFGSWFYKDIPGARKRIKNLDKYLNLTASYDGYKTKI